MQIARLRPHRSIGGRGRGEPEPAGDGQALVRFTTQDERVRGSAGFGRRLPCGRSRW